MIYLIIIYCGFNVYSILQSWDNWSKQIDSKLMAWESELPKNAYIFKKTLVCINEVSQDNPKYQCVL